MKTFASALAGLFMAWVCFQSKQLLWVIVGWLIWWASVVLFLVWVMRVVRNAD